MTTLDQALRAAMSTDPSVRLEAAMRLGTLADEQVAPQLVTMLVHEPDPFVREMLTWAVVTHGGATLPALLAELDGESPARAQVLHALSKIGDARAVPGALRLVDDPDPAVSAKAWWALGRIGSAEAVPVLVARLGQGDDERRNHLSRALEQLGAPAVPALAEALRTGGHDVRRHAADVLALIGDPDARPAAPALVEAIERSAADPEERDVAVAAMEALAPLQSPEVDAALTRMREGESRWLATVADWLLGQRGEG